MMNTVTYAQKETMASELTKMLTAVRKEITLFKSASRNHDLYTDECMNLLSKIADESVAVYKTFNIDDEVKSKLNLIAIDCRLALKYKNNPKRVEYLYKKCLSRLKDCEQLLALNRSLVMKMKTK